MDAVLAKQARRVAQASHRTSLLTGTFDAATLTKKARMGRMFQDAELQHKGFDS